MLTAEQIAALGRSSVRIATLVELQFLSGTVRVWNGAGMLSAGGVSWTGLGLAGSIDGLPQSRSLTADKVTFRLSHTDPRVPAVAAAGVDDVLGRQVIVSFQLLDEDWQAWGAMIPAWWGIMQRPLITRAPQGADGAGGAFRVVAIEAENAYAGRSRPAAGRYTDRDQQTLWPGDLACRFVAAQRTKTIVWPNFPEP